MSQENLELVRAAYDAWNRGDLGQAAARLHPDVEFVQDSRVPGAVNLVGAPAVQAWLESFQETWESFQIALERIEELDDGARILAVARISAKGRTSGAEVQQEVAHVFTVRDAQVVRWQSYADPRDVV